MKKLIAILIGIMLMSISVYAAQPSSWAKESVEGAITAGIVPDTLQSSYTSNITRKEFCHLAVQAYMAKTGYTIPYGLQTPFVDIDDDYVTAAYTLDIVSGVGDNRFNPDSNITRQEAAVMLNNLAGAAGVDNGRTRADKFVDESYFAEWAKTAIYKVSAIKSGDTAVMTGTGKDKFSPWMNYTREQAVATVYRLYGCDSVPVTIPQTDSNIYYVDDNSLCKLDVTDNSVTKLVTAENAEIRLLVVSGDEIYYALYDLVNRASFRWAGTTEATLYKVNTDGTDNVALTPKSIDVYVGHKYIYYSPLEAKSTVVRTELDGTNPVVADFSGLGGDKSWCYIESDKNDVAYIRMNEGTYFEQYTETEHLYAYDFLNASYKEMPRDTNITYTREDTKKDGKYVYYIYENVWYPTHYAAFYELHKCNLDGTGDSIVESYSNECNSSVIKLYNGSLYLKKSAEDSCITVVDNNGNEKNINLTKGMDYDYNIIGVSDGKIYYSYIPQEDNTQRCLASIDVDGNGNVKLGMIG